MSLKKDTNFEYTPVSANPVKSFFVEMLTRDISLTDSILDLLDNCVDGIVRKGKKKRSKTPYSQHFAEIVVNKDSFSIHDNCGGIPWELHEYAFKMGRDGERKKDKEGTVGVYGIGMKRAIFKIGRDCLISTQSGEHNYELAISPDWIANESDWLLPVSRGKKSMAEDGTTIYISNLRPDIASTFSSENKSFIESLKKTISTHYALILSKGFKVKINGEEITPQPTELVFSKQKGKSIKPYIFSGELDDITVKITVGFTRPLDSAEQAESEREDKKRSKLEAGWTVICNDRVILYCNRDELTGWGEADIPNFHNQFNAISGFVEFKCSDPSKLPTNTTKRGVESNSRVYLQAKNRMREGIRPFIDYTNWWKADLDTAKAHISKGEKLTIDNIEKASQTLKFNTVKRGIPGKQFKPDLPKPTNVQSKDLRISFTRPRETIERVSEYLSGDRTLKPSKVGEACFDEIERASK